MKDQELPSQEDRKHPERVDKYVVGEDFFVIGEAREGRMVVVAHVPIQKGDADRFEGRIHQKYADK
ncbi:hypothetical protein [Cohnella rhizosphaerae]|uniref:Uncharacterized protein n=1 Tax=Cohnella rhizosphaerae TaxID=1457232 RepID=A0A9X4QQL1_9BACL|nr:hypothetical protein [Cohnella rhizosphaerae]MDG0808151.1 hypothetical protein [Cohnella rhizosphaerae]